MQPPVAADADLREKPVESCPLAVDMDLAAHAVLEYVLSIAKTDPNRVWTLSDGDDGNMYISSGYHLVNRINYFITAVPLESSVPYLEVPYYIFDESEDDEEDDDEE